MDKGLWEHSHLEVELSSLKKHISKIKNVLHDTFMNDSFMPFKLHQEFIVVISVSCFPSLITVFFGCGLFVNHHESDCKMNRVLLCKCENWHYRSLFQLCPFLPDIETYTEPMKWQSKKKGCLICLMHS